MPIDEEVDVICKQLLEDETLDERSALQLNSIAGLLDLCLRSTYICLKDTFYEQREGVAMGLPVLAVVANLYMEHFEHLALESAPAWPRIWKIYVDDTCCEVKFESAVEVLHRHINSIHLSIQFTAELENEDVLPFLDTLVKRMKDGRLDISVYRKRKHTARLH